MANGEDRRRGFRFAPGVAAVATVVVWLLAVQHGLPPLPASIAAAGACLGAMLASRSRRRRALWFNLGAVLLLVGFFDAWARPDSRITETQTNEGFWIEDSDLGYRLGPNGSSHHQRAIAGTPIFDALYTTDASGWRTGLAYAGQAPEDCVLVFGCSFAFGGGLNDDQTLPYQLAVRLRDRMRVRNLAVGGYGPHHLLAMLQGGTIERSVDCRPRHALYVVIKEHILRAAGRGDGLRGGPRFERHGQAALVRRGNYPTEASATLAERFALAAALTGDPSTRNDEEIALYRAIVVEARRELERLYPGIQFHLFIWDPRGPNDAAIFAGLGATSVTWVDEALPKPPVGPNPYHFAHDGHPTAYGNRLLAAFLATELFGAPKDSTAAPR